MENTFRPGLLYNQRAYPPHPPQLNAMVFLDPLPKSPSADKERLLAPRNPGSKLSLMIRHDQGRVNSLTPFVFYTKVCMVVTVLLDQKHVKHVKQNG